MRTIVFLALVAAALAHWPYANNEDRFRTSSLTIHGSAALHTSYFWIFYPLNNQMQPTFQLQFPNKPADVQPVPAPTEPVVKSVTYTLQLSHIAEVKPNGGTFNLVPESTIPFSSELWTVESPLWFFDEETFGEVIELQFEPDCASGTLDNWLQTTILLRVYPDSNDDLIDILIYFTDYTFIDQTSFVAVFWKLASSLAGNGDEDLPAAMPLSVDFNDITFEMDGDVHYDQPATTKRESNRPTKATSFKKKSRKPSLHRKAMLEMKQRSFERKVSNKRDMEWPEQSTSGQLWFTGGYIATVFGQFPGELHNGLDLASTVTVALRTPHLRAAN